MGESDPFGLDQLDEQRRIVAAGIDLLDAGERRRPREAPGVNVEHRSDRHIDVVAIEAPVLRRESEQGELGHCVQHKLTMAEVDAFRQAGRARRVESRRLHILVEIGKGVIRRGGREKLLVFAGELKLARRRRLTVAERDKRLDLRQLRQDRLNEIDKLVVDEERRRPCMIDRIGDLLRRQTDVDRLQHRSHHRDGEKRFEISVAVPVKHADRVAGPHADRGQRAREPSDAVPKLSVSETLEIAVDDLPLRRLHHRRMEQLLDQQRIPVRGRRHGDHPAVHGRSPARQAARVGLKIVLQFAPKTKRVKVQSGQVEGPNWPKRPACYRLAFSSSPSGEPIASQRKSLGALPVQRRNACRKFAASLNPSANAISSFVILVSRK